MTRPEPEIEPHPRNRHHQRLPFLGGWLLAVLALLFVAKGVQAQGGIFINIAPPDTDNIYVGDVITMTLAVRHPQGYRVIAPEFEAKWGDLEVYETLPPLIIDNEDGTETSLQPILTTAWSPGFQTTAPFEVVVSNPEGVLVTVSAESVTFTVDSILVEDNTDDLQDIKPQATLPLPSNTGQWMALGAGGLVLLGLFGWFVARQLRQGGTIRQPVDARPAHVIALSELSAIQQLNLPAKGEFKRHYTDITDVLRRYIERAHNIDALDRTTSELRAALSTDSQLKPETQQQLIALLQGADLVKFADITPEMASAKTLPDRAKGFVNLSENELAALRAEAERRAAAQAGG